MRSNSFIYISSDDDEARPHMRRRFSEPPKKIAVKQEETDVDISDSGTEEDGDEMDEMDKTMEDPVEGTESPGPFDVEDDGASS